MRSVNCHIFLVRVWSFWGASVQLTRGLNPITNYITNLPSLISPSCGFLSTTVFGLLLLPDCPLLCKWFDWLHTCIYIYIYIYISLYAVTACVMFNCEVILISLFECCGKCAFRNQMKWNVKLLISLSVCLACLYFCLLLVAFAVVIVCFSPSPSFCDSSMLFFFLQPSIPFLAVFFCLCVCVCGGGLLFVVLGSVWHPVLCFRFHCKFSAWYIFRLKISSAFSWYKIFYLCPR